MEKNVEIAVNAYQNTSFYRAHYAEFMRKHGGITKDNFSDLPILQKKDVQDNWKSLLDNSSSSYSKAVQYMHTSGSTGRPLSIMWEKSDYIRSNLALWVIRKNFYHIMPSDSYCTFHSVAYEAGIPTRNEVYIYNQGRTLTLGRYRYTEEVLNDYTHYITDFQPAWIQGPPSVLYCLYRFLKDRHVRFPSLKYIELNGEYVEPHIWKELKEYFNVPVANLYGAIEFNGIAITCPHGHMHILSDNVYVELASIQGMEQLIITSLSNHRMPLIRYAIGDVGRLIDCPCHCGLKQELILTRGRVHELLELTNGNVIDPTVFTNVVRDMNKERCLVQQYYVRIRRNELALQLLSNPEDVLAIQRKKAYYEGIVNQLIHHAVPVVIEVGTRINYMNVEKKPTYIYHEEDKPCL